MSEVLLGQSYYLRFDAKLAAAMQPYAPVGSLLAAAVLRARGFDVAFFDAMLADSEREWAAALDRERPRLAVLFEDNFNYLTKMCLLRMRDAAFAMIGLARERGCTVAVAGSDASDHPAEYLAAGADFVIVGEGEATLAELAERLTGRTTTPLEEIAGLAFVAVREPGEVRLTPSRPVLRDLDTLPFPAWDLVDVERYRRIWRARHGRFSMSMVTTRGCPYHCNWCAKPIWGQRYNARSPESVVEELAWLRERFAPDHVWFMDDIFGLKPGWIERFAEQVEARGVRTPFKSLHRVDLLLRGDTIAALARAGAEEVWVGAESGSQTVLDAMEKGTTVGQIEAATHRLHGAGVRVGFFLQFGYPGETRADIDATLAMVRRCRPDDIGVSVSYPLPGTAFHARVAEQLGGKRNWDDSADLAMLYRGPFPTAFYRELHAVVHAEFRARRGARELGAALRRPGTLRLRHLRTAANVVRHAAHLAFGRRRLDRLARRPHRGIGPLPHIAGIAAASPSREED